MVRVIVFFFLFIIFNPANCEACSLTLSEKLFIPKLGSITGVKFSKNCSRDQIHETTQKLSSFNGKIKNAHISKNLQIPEITIINEEATSEFIQLAHMISEQLKTKKINDIQLENTPFLSILRLEDQISIDCSNCLSHGKNLGTIIARNQTGEEVRIPFSIHLSETLTAFQIISTIPAFTDNINASSLREIPVEENPHYKFFTDISKLHFFKSNKQLNPGDFLKQSDLTPINLVRAGSKTEISLENNLIKIKIFGLSKSNGGFGDKVEIYQREKNKIYIGKVIDENKVMVQL